MQHRSSRPAAIGVDMGTSATIVSIRSPGDRATTRALDGVPAAATADALTVNLGRVRVFRDDTEVGPAPIAITVPASWERDRKQEIADAAERVGLGLPTFVTSAEAAAVYVDKVLGRKLEPGDTLVIYSLGAGTCEVSVIRRGPDGHTVLASRGTDVGGREFDDLVLAYLSGRHRDTDPEFWDKIESPAGPADEALRSALIAEIRSARERLSDQPSTEIALHRSGVELQLTQPELESCIGELVEQTCGLAMAVLEESGIDPAEAAGLLLTGGASRTPLVVARLVERTGLQPFLPEKPELVHAEGAALTALAAVPPAPNGSRFRRTARRAAILVSLLVVAVGAAVIFGSELGTGDKQPPEGAGSASAEAPSEAASPVEGGTEPGSDGATPGEEARTHAPGETRDAESPTESEDESPSPTGDGSEESAAAGAVPDVVSMSSQEAEQALTDAGFTNVEFESEPDPLFGPWYDDCEVKEQHPAPETTHAFDEPVTVTYSYSGSDTDTCES